MGLHIEISGGLDRKEWQGVKLLAMVMLGEVSADAIVAAALDHVDPFMPELAKPAPETSAGAAAEAPVVQGTGAAEAPVPAAPVPPIPAAAAIPPAPPVAPAPPAPPIDPGAIPPAGSMMAGAAEGAAAAVAAGATLDSRGFPWDARIHAGTKSVKSDKSWTYKRGTDKALIDAVETELRAVMAAPASPAAPAAAPIPPAPEASSAPQSVTDPAAAFGGGAPAPSPALAPVPPSGEAATPPAPPVAPSPAEAPPPAAGEAGATPDNITEFARIMRVVVAKQNSGGLTTEVTTQIAQQLGLTSVRDLAKRPDLIPAFEALLP